MYLKKKVSFLFLLLLCTLWFSFPIFASEFDGNIDQVGASGISGFAWDKQTTEETVTVELLIYADGSDTPAKILNVKADSYNARLAKKIGDGNHYFSTPVNWSELEGTTFKIEAYAISDEERFLFPGASQYTKGVSEEVGPGIEKKAPEPEPVDEEPSDQKGASLGMFSTTAYCNCVKCSSGHSLTYSGTVPQANHTISADISIFPLGTKLMIGDTIYTVEDIGSGVNGHKLDIYFNTHAEALAYGRKSVEVFAVE